MKQEELAPEKQYESSVLDVKPSFHTYKTKQDLREAIALIQYDNHWRTTFRWSFQEAKNQPSMNVNIGLSYFEADEIIKLIKEAGYKSPEEVAEFGLIGKNMEEYWKHQRSGA